MNIALDFDNTYTKAPEFWRQFMSKCFEFNYGVCIVTARDGRFDRCPMLDDLEAWVDVYYCRGVAKKWWMEQFASISIDIWIDDKPEAILNNSVFTKSELEEWRATREY